MQKEDAYTLDDLLEKAKVYIKSDEDIFSLLKNDYNGTLKNFLAKNFHFNYENDDFTIKLPDDYDKVAKVVKDNLKTIKNNIKNRKNMSKYG